MKTASRILFIEIVKTLKNTKKSPNQPKITAIDNKLEPKSPWSKFCILLSKLDRFNSTLLKYLSIMANGQNLELFKSILTSIFNRNDL